MAMIRLSGPVGLFFRLKECADRVKSPFPRPYNGTMADQVTSGVSRTVVEFNELLSGIDTIIADHEKVIELLRADRANIFAQATEQGYVAE
jgi:hypothetical protein